MRMMEDLGEDSGREEKEEVEHVEGVHVVSENILPGILDLNF